MSLPLRLTEDALRRMWPRASDAIIKAFATNQKPLADAGILDNPYRVAYCFANLAHETGGWTIRNLTENINYTHARVAQVWPNRYSSAAAVAARFGTGPGWQLKMFDEIYGGRMGNRKGTSDGSAFIGRGGPQITGRDGYAKIQQLTGIPLLDNPELATISVNQPAIAAAFWKWKGLNDEADAQNFNKIVLQWNGGYNGMADRQQWLARILPIAKSLSRGPVVTLPSPPVASPKPPATPTPTPGEKATDWAAIAALVSAALYYVPYIAAAGIGLAVLGFIGYNIWKTKTTTKPDTNDTSGKQ